MIDIVIFVFRCKIDYTKLKKKKKYSLGSTCTFIVKQDISLDRQ